MADKEISTRLYMLYAQNACADHIAVLSEVVRSKCGETMLSSLASSTQRKERTQTNGHDNDDDIFGRAGNLHFANRRVVRWFENIGRQAEQRAANLIPLHEHAHAHTLDVCLRLVSRIFRVGYRACIFFCPCALKRDVYWSDQICSACRPGMPGRDQQFGHTTHAKTEMPSTTALGFCVVDSDATDFERRVQRSSTPFTCGHNNRGTLVFLHTQPPLRCSRNCASSVHGMHSVHRLCMASCLVLERVLQRPPVGQPAGCHIWTEF